MTKISAIIISAFLATACTTSSVVMTGKARPPIPVEDVQIYLRLPVGKLDSIGLVVATSNLTPIRSANREYAIEELRKKAASLGANGLLLNPNEGSPGPTTGVFVPSASPGGVGMFVGGGSGPMVEFQSEAIYVYPN